MNKYAQTAIRAVEYIKAGFNAEQAWEKASCEYFEKGSSSQKKGCPKGAFLGLFSKNSGKNADYATKALEILREHPQHKYSKYELWKLVTDGEVKAHNSQMDVVLALWNNNLIG